MDNENLIPPTPDAVTVPIPKFPAAKPSVLIYSCSGCSNAGELADRISRRLAREGAAEMSCLAGIGGRVKSLVRKAESAERILVVDGCPLNCARKTLEFAGFTKFDHLQLHRIGVRKGSTPVTEERITSGVDAAKGILAGETPSVSKEESRCQTNPVAAVA